MFLNVCQIHCKIRMEQGMKILILSIELVFTYLFRTLFFFFALQLS